MSAMAIPRQLSQHVQNNLRTLGTQLFCEMQYKIVVKHHLNILPNILVSVGNATAVWNVASQNIQSLSRVVPGMQPHPDANDTITASCVRLSNIQ
jgi:hypothetical protein